MDNIIEQFKNQFPDIYPVVLTNDRYVTYSVLQHFGAFCAQNFAAQKSKDILNTIGALYTRDNLFNRNAIENEFFSPLAQQLGVNNLTEHLQNIPENMWGVYLKVLIETQKIK